MNNKSLFEDEKRGQFNLYEDWVFRYIYSKDNDESRQALMAVLNVILNRKKNPIIGIKIQNPFFLREEERGKECVLDILARTSSGEIIDIEMQNKVQADYTDRMLMYGGQMVKTSLEKGQKYDMMKKSIVISFVNGVQFPEIAKIHTSFRVLEEEEHILMTDKLGFHYIELGKIDPQRPVEELTEVEKLAAYMLYAGDKAKEDYVQKLIETGGDAVTMTEKIFSELTDDEMAWAYKFSRDKAEHDRLIEEQRLKSEARAEGLEEGRAEGLEEGRAKGRIEGFKEVILMAIKGYLEDGKSETQVIDKMVRHFKLTEELAVQYLEEAKAK